MIPRRAWFTCTRAEEEALVIAAHREALQRGCCECYGVISQAAAKILAGHKLSPGDWVACYPAGVANVTMKAWPGPAVRSGFSTCR